MAGGRQAECTGCAIALFHEGTQNMAPNLLDPFPVTGKNLGNPEEQDNENLMASSEVKHSQSCPGDTSAPWAGD